MRLPCASHTNGLRFVTLTSVGGFTDKVTVGKER
jgi:hypothetical protein